MKSVLCPIERLAIYLLAVAGLLGTCSVAAQQSIEHTRLIPNTRGIPTVVPATTWDDFTKSGIVPRIARLGTYFNEAVVKNKFQEALDEDTDRGFEMMAKTGQRGMLLKAQILARLTPAGQTYYSLRGDGVLLVGVGPDANAVCLAHLCPNILEDPVPPGAMLTKESGYIWVGRKGTRYVIQRYDIDAMNARTSTIAADKIGLDTASHLARAAALSDYTSALLENAKQSRRIQEIKALAAEREAAATKLNSIEKTLADELRRQERIAKTSATLNALAGALSLASAVSSASLTVGEDVTKISTNEIKSPQDLVNALSLLSNDSKAKVIFYTAQQTTLTSALGKVESNIIQIGLSYGLDPGKAPVLVPPSP